MHLRGGIGLHFGFLLAPLFAQISSPNPAATGHLGCATTSVPRNLRSGGLTELIGDIVLTCTGGPLLTPGDVIPTVNITVFLNTPVTNRLMPALRAIDAVLLVDEPRSGLPPVVPGFGPDAPQIPCLAGDGGCTEYVGGGPIPTAVIAPRIDRPGPNMFIGTASGNQVTFYGIPVLPPGAASTRVFRITDIRVSTSGLAGTRAVVASLSISPNAALPLANPVLTTGYLTAGLATSVRTADNSDDVPAGGTTFGQCSSAAMAPVALLQFSELFGSAFKTRVAPTATSNGQSFREQNIPGQTYDSESGFVTFAFGPPVGLVDSGTRLKAVFDGVPAGVHLYVSVASLAAATSARLITSELEPDGNGAVPAAAPTSTVNAGTTDVAEIAVINGSATAVWEVTGTNPAALESLRFGLWVSYAADPANGSPPPGAATVRLGYAPTPGPSTATIPLPRFADATPVGTPVFTVGSCQTTLLFPYLTNEGGFEAGLAIANTTLDPFSTPAQSGACVFNWYDGKPHVATGTGVIPAGTVRTFLVSDLLPGDFTGYAIARCNFSFAHGFALIGSAGLRDLAAEYLAIVLGPPSPRSATGPAESVFH